MTMRIGLVLLALLGGVAACSSSSASPCATATLPATFGAQSQVAILSPACGAADAGAPCGTTLLILQTDAPSCGTCAELQPYLSGGSSYPSCPDADTLTLELVGTRSDVAPGTYPIELDGGTGASAGFEVGSPTLACPAPLNTPATAGSITLTQVSASGVTGSYSLVFGAQRTLAGDFDIPVCNLGGDLDAAAE